MKEKPPLVSIIVATYNRAHLISQSLRSIINQSYNNWECLIINDDSTDNTEFTVKEVIENDKRFKYHLRGEKHKKGLSGSRNKGLDLALGEYIIFFDDDDIVHPDCVKISLQQIMAGDFDFCHFEKQSFTNFVPKFNDKSDFYQYPIGKHQIENVVKNEIPMSSCTVLWKKECFDHHRFNEELMYAEEWEAYIGILISGYQGIGISKVLYFNRKHNKSNTGEFWQHDPNRRSSFLKAQELVIDRLVKAGIFNNDLKRYFIQTAIFVKEKSLLQFIHSVSKSSRVENIKYNLLYDLYPFIVQGHRIKKKFK